MSRLALVFDRMMVFLIGIGLFALGLGAVAWQRGVLWQGGPVDLSALTAVTGTSWWPWAQAAAGVLLVLAALRWLMAHHQAPRLTRLPLPDEQGLSADPNAVAHVAADLLAQQPGVVKATGRAAAERDFPTITLTVTVAARNSLDTAVATTTDVARTMALMLGDAVAVRTVLRVDTKARRRIPL
ncbi:hypothetical protein MMUR_02210 [Mycolicibacterium murale]|jgi:hypothetical protein|uniref:Alkaline shock response membrane anchor protein AmaP n=1 Tax=Mycolicibacterium murale TaxID=182220 RepID=A0A7I9WEA9_9MYCO|nr:hypothetical protein [Mycolicibacterium murale]ANW62492.1 hypothetical protein BCA37_01705 [Mycobacterium sp. djl-10]MCV7182259.1 hypothetical protein [Mycolicibacterium murale]GFG56085.1 hypothetical protein MMUR_02210 [Mycolicibacterium murale]